MDCKDYININNPRAVEQVLNLKIECNLINSWTELNLEKKLGMVGRNNILFCQNILFSR